MLYALKLINSLLVMGVVAILILVLSGAEARSQTKGANEAVESQKIQQITDNSLSLIKNHVFPHTTVGHQPGYLYYFISFSMPDPLIKAYMLDAIWTGGTLVLRGVTPKMNLHQFIFTKIYPLVNYKGAHAEVDIDPNLYELFDITAVPSIVLAPTNEKPRCVKGKGKSSGCLPEAEENYFKVSGNVSTTWALERFEEAGAQVALLQERLAKRETLQKNLTEPEMRPQLDNKTESLFRGDWEAALLPDQSGVSDLLAKQGLGELENGAIGDKSVVEALHEKPAPQPRVLL
ncbi:MAG: Type-F conjugative transfer system pilin assembly protein TrbC [Gammaproteobacteria bacterium]|jgi:type-F conjugative transfer system pilin assembly protein TrbC|nr:Type-F conjugative transfer system pilin assembly protein TrbC [Gammaproteobacteria bacterium]